MYRPHPFFDYSRPRRHGRPDTIPTSPSQSTRPAPSVVTIPVLDPSQSPAIRTTPSRPFFDPAIAATRIQACFRGFSVRRHKPLSLLRAIASVCRQLDGFESEIHTSDFLQRIRSNDKDRLRISEAIMNLLLRLDSIQGALPEIRSRRKEATRKAILLQDSIDGAVQQRATERLNLNAQTEMTQPTCESSAQEPSSVADMSYGGRAKVCIDDSADRMDSTGNDYGDTSSLCLENGSFVPENASDLCSSTNSSEDIVPQQVALAANTNVGPDFGDSLAVENEQIKLLGEDQNQTLKEVSAELRIDEESNVCHIDDGVCKSETVARCTKEGIADQQEKFDEIIAPENCIFNRPVSNDHRTETVMTQLEECINACLDGMENPPKESVEELQGSCINTMENYENMPNTTNLQCSTVRIHGTEGQKEHISTQLRGCTNICLDGQWKEPTTQLQDCTNVYGDRVGNQLQWNHEEDSNEAGRNGQSSGKEILQQMTHDCDQLKFLIGKLICQTRAQSKAICELNGRIETLEREQQQQSSKKPDVRKGSSKKMKRRPRTIRGFPYDEFL